MSNLPVPRRGAPSISDIVETTAKSPLAEQYRRNELKRQAKAPRQQHAPDAPGVAQLADQHIQLWRSGMVKLIMGLALRDDLDALTRELEGLEGWKELKRASLESTRVMAALRPFWNPDDKVEIRD